ncbi:MAG: LysM peptidoglycan-binding domain-containing protein [Deltaproteobacteria bacterium]|nr:LysM peptidoglycan-binding domain-containing protein [Deltaproteobacteria bacterium]
MRRIPAVLGVFALCLAAPDGRAAEATDGGPLPVDAPDPPEDPADDEDPPPDAEPAASDIIEDMEATTTGGEGGEGKLPEPEAPAAPTPPAPAPERTLRRDLLPPVDLPVDDDSGLRRVAAPARLGVHMLGALGTEGLSERVREAQSREEAALLADYLRRTVVIRRTSGPLDVAGDIPMADNDMVRRWITFFQGVGAKYYRLWVARYWRYGPMMRKILVEEGLPSDTVYLSMIESGFSPKAYSFAHAAGPWQFIRPTGVRMGLAVNYWLDERRDPIKATYAASRYLAELYRTWGDWHLAWASYNAGPGKVSRAIHRQRTREFFALARTRSLRWETRNYVPKLLAAATIARDPAQYGFDGIEPLAPFEFDVLTLTENLHLAPVARACGTDVEVLLELNPALRRPITPPPTTANPTFDLRVPPRSLERCQAGLVTLTEGERARYRRHHVRPGDTLAAVAARYQTRTDLVVAENNLPNQKLQPGEDLIIPVPPGGAIPAGDLDDDVTERRGRVVKAAPPRGSRHVKVVVRKGDTLWDIAVKHGVDVRSVAAWNGLNRRRRLRVGQQLVLYVKDPQVGAAQKPR